MKEGSYTVVSAPLPVAVSQEKGFVGYRTRENVYIRPEMMPHTCTCMYKMYMYMHTMIEIGPTKLIVL